MANGRLAIPGSFALRCLAIVVAFACVLLLSSQPTYASGSVAHSIGYTNPIYGYSVSYPATWHRWSADDRLAQEFSNYNEVTAPSDFPALSAYAKVEVDALQKPASQSLAAWMSAKVDRPDRPEAEYAPPPDSVATTSIAGRPAVVQMRGAQSPSRTVAFVDDGPVVFILSAVSAKQANASEALAIMRSFKIVGQLHLAQSAMPSEPTLARAPKPSTSRPTPYVICCGGGWSGLTLPLKVDYANGMASISMNGGGVNSWFDHQSPTGATNGSLTRYDGQVLSNSGGCTLGTSCYDGHNGIDFSTDGMTGIPVYASDYGTVTTQYQTVGGNCIFVQSSGVSNLSTQDCHLSSYVVTSGFVNAGQLIAYSGCTGTGCSGPHVHFGAYDTAVSGWPAVDPFGWSGSGSDPWSYDSGFGYMWGNSPPSFIGGAIYTVNASLSSGWTSFTDAYGVKSYWSYTTSGSATTSATWTAPYSGACYGVEVWIPAGSATANPAKYTVHLSNGSSTTVNVNQNANMAWYTIYPTNYSSGITTVTMSNSNGVNGQQIGASKVWFSC
jgi:murein DD-endopeptidase MepM/ murein hydrolase activator NlpD